MDDPDYWMCPLDEQDRAPLLGPKGGAAGGTEVAVQGGGGSDPGTATKPWRHGFLPMTVDQYLDLLDWTGRQRVPGKRGAIEAQLPPILERLRLRPAAWLEMIEKFEIWFHGDVGRVGAMMEQAARTGRRWIQGTSHCGEAFL